jgi:hypothetical protein
MAARSYLMCLGLLMGAAKPPSRGVVVRRIGIRVREATARPPKWIVGTILFAHADLPLVQR